MLLVAWTCVRFPFSLPCSITGRLSKKQTVRQRSVNITEVFSQSSGEGLRFRAVVMPRSSLGCQTDTGILTSCLAASSEWTSTKRPLRCRSPQLLDVIVTALTQTTTTVSEQPNYCFTHSLYYLIYIARILHKNVSLLVQETTNKSGFLKVLHK